MNLCRYDTSKPCGNHEASSRTCLDCVLGKIRAEIKEESRFCPLTEGLERALEIIDKYTAEKE